MVQRGIFYRHFDLPANFPVIGLLGPDWHGEHMEQFRLHFHNCLEIGYISAGDAIYYLRDEEILLHAPCLTIAPPNAPHITNAQPGVICDWKWLYLDPIRLLPHMDPKYAAELGVYQYQLSGADCVLSREQFPRLYDLMTLILSVMEDGQGENQGIVRELLHAFFLMLISMHPLSGQSIHSSRYEGVLAPAIAYIQAFYMRDLTVGDLAFQCHLSEAHFRRIFKETYGWSPLDYIHMIRMERACKLLLDDELSMNGIAASVGYQTPSTFTRQFHHFFGMSPSQWRQKMEREENDQVTRYLQSLPPQAQTYFPADYLQQLGPTHLPILSLSEEISG